MTGGTIRLTEAPLSKEFIENEHSKYISSIVRELYHYGNAWVYVEDNVPTITEIFKQRYPGDYQIYKSGDFMFIKGSRKPVNKL